VAGCANGRRRVGTLGLALAAALLGARAAPAQTAVPANLAPVLSFEPDPAGGHWIPWTTLVERRWLNLGLRVSDPDGDAVTVAASPLPPGAVLRDPGPRDPLYPFRHARYFDWTPAAGQAGTYPVTFTASDGRASTSQTVVFTVRSTVGPRPPVIAPIPDTTLAFGVTFATTIVATDPDGDAVSLRLASARPANATFDARTGELSWWPQIEGVYRLTFVASDGLSLAIRTGTFTIPSRVPPNARPTFGPFDGAAGRPGTEITWVAGTASTLVVPATDQDGDPLIFSVEWRNPNPLRFDPPAGAVLDPATGVLTWTPAPGQEGTYVLQFRVREARDAGRDARSPFVTLIVLPDPAGGPPGPAWTRVATTGPALGVDPDPFLWSDAPRSTLGLWHSGDTYALDAASGALSLLVPASAWASPSGRSGSLAFDRSTGRAVFVPGRNDHRYATLEEVWAWDGTRWTLERPAGPRPDARHGHALAYDSLRRRVVLFGGQRARRPQDLRSDGDPRYLHDLWEWDGTRWSLVRTVGAPPGRAKAALAYDEFRRQLVLFGGERIPPWGGRDWLDDTWIYDPATRRWTEVVTARPPAEREAALIAYDPARARTFLYGGRLGGVFSYAVSRDLWEWDGATWTEVPLPGLAPAGRGALAYDGAQKRLVLCDGEDLFEHRPDMPWLAAPDWRGALGAGPIDLRSRVDVDVTVELTESFVNVHGRLAGQVSDWSERWSLLLRLTGTGPDDLSLSIEGVPAEYAGGVPGRATIGADGTFVFGAGNGGRSPSAIVDARQRAISGRILPGREVRIESIATSRFFWHAASPAVSRIQVVRLAAEAAGFLHP